MPLSEAPEAVDGAAQLTAELRRSESRYRTVVDNVADVIVHLAIQRKHLIRPLKCSTLGGYKT